MKRSYFFVYLFSSLLFFAATIVISHYYFLEGKAFETSTLNEQRDTSTQETDRDIVYQSHSDFLTPTHFVNFAYLNVRKTPTIFSERIRVLEQNDQVVLFKQINHDWCQIEPEGYVACRYLSPL